MFSTDYLSRPVFQKMGLILKIVVFMLCLSIPMQASAVLLFHDDFEREAIGSTPDNWEIGHKGDTVAEVVADPKDASNRVLKTSDKASDASRHDVGGSIYVVGGENWDDYVAEWDMMFPDDFYMGIVFRFQGGERFCLSDRRQGGREYHFHKREGNWAQIQAGMVENQPEIWYRAQLILAGDQFTFKLKERKNTTPFEKTDPATEGKDGTLKTGKFGNYGLVYLDNIFIGDAVEDLALPIEPQDKVSISWGALKAAY